MHVHTGGKVEAGGAAQAAGEAGAAGAGGAAEANYSQIPTVIETYISDTTLFTVIIIS